MKKAKAAKKTKNIRHKLSVVFRLPALLVVLLLLAYFVLLPAIIKVEWPNWEGGIPIVSVDGAEEYINMGPDKNTFIVEVASTEASRQKGLSGRHGLDQSHGMLFVFDMPDDACFWMKEMQFDIDILWFDQDRKLVWLKQEAAPSSYPKSFCTPMPAKYVIEAAAGTAERLHLKVGDTFSQP